MKDKNNSPLMWLLRIIQGALIGSGAILPGISGGVMCVSFGIYRPMMELLSSPKKSFPKYWKLFVPIIIGWVGGFFLFAGLIDFFLSLSVTVTVSAFVGLIAGTLPSLYREAGQKGRNIGSYISFGVSFVLMLALFLFLESLGGEGDSIAPVIPLGIGAFLFCGVLWGLSLIVPGMSSSPTLMALGLYEPMNAGIASFDISVLLPMIIGLAATVLLLAKTVSVLFEKFYSIAYHIILGFTLASLVVIVPTSFSGATEVVLSILLAAVGFAAAFFMEKLKADIE